MSNPNRIAVADEEAATAAAAAATTDTTAPPPRVELAAICANCGDKFQGRFCGGCGEKRIAGEDYSLRRFLTEAFNILTSVESNLFRSFATLITKPGQLTAEYFKGRRKSYLKPLQLFVFCNVIFFFAQASINFNSLTTPLYVHLNMLPYSRLARTMVEGELQRRQITYDDYRPRFDAAIGGQAKTLVIVMVPLFALAMQVLYRRRCYYVEHLVFSTHFFAFFLLFVAALHSGLHLVWRGERIAGFKLPILHNDGFVTLGLLSVCGIYLFIALGRVYGQGKITRVMKSLALVGCVMGVLQLYRFILFFTTFYAI